MISVQDVTKIYNGTRGTVHALDNVSFEVNPGDFVAVQGPSGSGKTTLLLTVGGLLVPDGGSVRVDGQDPYALSHEDRARLRASTIGFVFQQFHLVPYLSVFDNVVAPSLAMNQPDAQVRAVELIERFGLSDRMRHVPAELSTGERQRTALARALLNQPKILLADEPTGNIDGDNAVVVLGHMADFARDGGAVILVTHDVRASGYAQRMLTIKEGKIC